LNQLLCQCFIMAATAIYGVAQGKVEYHYAVCRYLIVVSFVKGPEILIY